MIETELGPLVDDVFSQVTSGGDGDGWRSDDGGEGWGWSEDPEEDDGPPYRRSRVIRAVAVATAAAVVLGSIGTWVVFLAVGSPSASFAVSAVETTLPGPGAGQPVEVRFQVANQSNTGSPATCLATLATTTATVGSATVRLPRLAGGQWDRVSVGVSVDPSALAGHGPATARVSCRPTPSR